MAERKKPPWRDKFFVTHDDGVYEVCTDTAEKGVTARLLECASRKTASTIVDLLNSKNVRICYDAGWHRKGGES
jgi:hypothetical protein